MNEWQQPRRPGRRTRIAGMIRRLEGRMRRDRELLWHPRLEFAAAREIAATHRQLEVLRRRLR
ncbi:MAG TPA: hypothetical protein VGB34_03540 [Candidatus Limnocylindria bacterium]|jgi:hypothetical protein